MSRNRIEAVEGEPEKAAEKQVRVTPPALKASAQVIRILEKLDRRGRVNVVNFAMGHFGLNEPPTTNDPSN